MLCSQTTISIFRSSPYLYSFEITLHSRTYSWRSFRDGKMPHWHIFQHIHWNTCSAVLHSNTERVCGRMRASYVSWGENVRHDTTFGWNTLKKYWFRLFSNASDNAREKCDKERPWLSKRFEIWLTQRGAFYESDDLLCDSQESCLITERYVCINWGISITEYSEPVIGTQLCGSVERPTNTWEKRMKTRNSGYDIRTNFKC